MSGTEWVRRLPDDVLERFWNACLQAQHSIDRAAGTANWALTDDVMLEMTREKDAWRNLAFVLKQEMERREYEPQEVQA